MSQVVLNICNISNVIYNMCYDECMLESFARAITDRWDCFAYTMEVPKAPSHSANAISACFASLVANIATPTNFEAKSKARQL